MGLAGALEPQVGAAALSAPVQVQVLLVVLRHSMPLLPPWQLLVTARGVQVACVQEVAQ